MCDAPEEAAGVGGFPGASVGNAVSDAVAGSVVQAGTVHGGVHVHTSPVLSASVVPRQLPLAASLVGRDDELARLSASAEVMDGSPVMAISGLPGVGKTSLAVQWLRRQRAPGGELYVDLQGHGDGDPLGPGEVLERFLRALNIREVPADLPERSALFRSATAERRMAVLLDNAISAAQVRPLLPGPGNVCVVTSRRHLGSLVLDGARVVVLEPLEAASCVELLSDVVEPERVDAEQRAARDLAALCGGLPLAIRLAGAWLALRPGRTITSVVAAMRAEAHRLAALERDGENTVTSALDMTYGALPSGAARAYLYLGLFPGSSFDVAVVAAVVGCSVLEAENLAETLVGWSLLTEIAPGRYRFHDLVRLHARACVERTEPAQIRKAVVRRIVEYHLARATAAEEVLEPHHRDLARDYAAGPPVVEPFADQAAALAWLDAERANLVAVVEAAEGAGMHAQVWQLVDAMWPLFLRRKGYGEWRSCHEAGARAAVATGDRAGHLRMLTSGGLGELEARNFDRAAALFRQAIALREEDGDRAGVGQALNYLGLALRGEQRWAQARGCFRDAARIADAAGLPRPAALARLNLGDVAIEQGELPEAVRCLEEAGHTLAGVGDAYNAARARVLLGWARARAGEPSAGVVVLEEAVARLRTMDAPHEVARALDLLGQVVADLGETGRAREVWTEALALYRGVGAAAAPDVERRLSGLAAGDADNGE